MRWQLTVVRHAHHQALLKAAVLAFVATLLVDAAVQVAVVVDQLQPYGSTEESLANERNAVRKEGQ